MYGVKKTTLSSPKIQTLSVPKPAHFAKAEDQGAMLTKKVTGTCVQAVEGRVDSYCHKLDEKYFEKFH